MDGIPDAILKLQTGKCLFIGKIVEVTRVIFLSSYAVFSALSIAPFPGGKGWLYLGPSPHRTITGR